MRDIHAYTTVCSTELNGLHEQLMITRVIQYGTSGGRTSNMDSRRLASERNIPRSKLMSSGLAFNRSRRVNNASTWRSLVARSMIVVSWSSSRSWKGLSPDTSVYRRMPADHTSALEPLYASLRSLQKVPG